MINEFYSVEGKEGKTMSMFLSTSSQIIFLAGDFLSCGAQKYLAYSHHTYMHLFNHPVDDSVSNS